MSEAQLARANRLREEAADAAKSVAERLQAADAPPFIGQLVLVAKERSAAINRICFFQDRLNALHRLLKHHPALALAFIAGEVAAQADDAADSRNVYSCIEQPLGLKLDNTARKGLVDAFRAAAIRLGLTVQSEHARDDRQWWVNELILQAGPRRTHASTLAEAFSAVEHFHELPDPADTTECRDFCRAAVTHLSNTPRLCLALQNDQTGWHAALYARLRAGELVAGSRLSQSLGDALVSLDLRRPAAVRRRAGFVLRGIDLCIALPGRGRLVLDGRHEVPLEGGEFTLPVPWPHSMEWRSDDQPSQRLPDWLSSDTACAIFDNTTGRLVGVARPGCRLEVPRADLALLCRSRFRIAGQPADEMLGSVHVSFVSLDREPVNLEFARDEDAKIVPREDRLFCLGPVLAYDLAGVAIMGAAVLAEISIPGEAGHRLEAEILLRHPAIPASGRRVRLTLDDAGAARIDLSTCTPQSGPAGRLRAALTLPGQERPLASTAVWYWPGLRAINGGRFDGPVPSNFSEELSRGVLKHDGGLRLFGDRPEAKLAFATFDAEPPEILSFIMPGVFADIERPGAPSGFGVSLPPRHPITLGGNLSWALRIACDHPDAVLEIGARSEPKAFARTKIRRISFASLYAAAEAGDAEVRIRYGGPADPPRSICILSRAETPTDFTLSARAATVEATFVPSRRVQDVQLEARELLSGQQIALTLRSGAPPAVINGQAELITGVANGTDSCTVRLHSPAWGEGIWVAELNCRLDGMSGYRPLQGRNAERFLLAFTAPYKSITKPSALWSVNEAESAFARAAGELAYPLASEVAESGKLLATLYRAAGRRLLEMDRRTAARSFTADTAGSLAPAGAEVDPVRWTTRAGLLVGFAAAPTS